MRSAAYRLIARAGLPRVFRTLRPHGVTILTYHGFAERESFDGVIDHQRMRLHVDAFERHLEHLVKHYRVVSLSSLVRAYASGRDAPSRAVVLTFDDGYRSCYTLAYPLLVRFGVPATFFLSTDFVFGGQPLWHDRVEYAVHATGRRSVRFGAGPELRTGTVPEKLVALRAIYRELKKLDQRERDALVDDLEVSAGARLDLSSAAEPYAPVARHELEEMVRGGLVDVGSHTKTHAILARCDAAGLESEVVNAKETIEGAVGRPCDLFCYPNGARGDFDERTRAALVRAGFACALTTIPGKNHASSDLMELRRVGAARDPAEFELAASGLRTELARAYHAARASLGRVAP